MNMFKTETCDHRDIYIPDVAANNIISGRVVINFTAALNSVLGDGSNMKSGKLVQKKLDRIMQI